MPPWVVIALSAALIAALVFGLAVYARLFRKLRAGACHVPADRYSPIDFGIVLGIAALLVNALVVTVSKPERVIDAERLWDGLLTYGVGVLFIIGLLVFRHIPVAAQFGFRVVKPGRALALGAGLIAAAFPIILLVSGIIQMSMGGKAQPQEIVEYFRHALADSDTASQTSVVLLASLAAPFAEEFIFRGYIYGVMKKFAGIAPALLLTSALFAAIHANLAAAAPLFLLAVALNVAYEVTGSILVPMAMHAIFNATQLAVICALARSTP
jgi:membrane protease YdiL (CAAX protease family)